MKKIIAIVIATIMLIGSCFVYAAEGHSTDITFCSNAEVYSVDYQYFVSEETDILSVKVNTDNCIYDWNYIKSEARLYISLASANPIPSSKALLTITTKDDVYLEPISVIVNGKTSANSEHTEEEIPAVEPTVEKPGSTAGIKCSLCGFIIKEPIEISRLPAVEIVKPSEDIVTEVEGTTVTVNYADTCRIGYLSGGKYIAVEARPNENGGYDFEVLKEITEVILVVAGDISGDGILDYNDKELYESVILSDGVGLSPEQFFAADVNVDGEIDIIDVILFAKSILDKEHDFYKEIEW